MSDDIVERLGQDNDYLWFITDDGYPGLRVMSETERRQEAADEIDRLALLLGRMRAEVTRLLRYIAPLTADLAAERALADDLAVELASVMSAAGYEHREPGDPLTRWEARRER